jgi:hypothetical protein
LIILILTVKEFCMTKVFQRGKGHPILLGRRSGAFKRGNLAVIRDSCGATRGFFSTTTLLIQRLWPKGKSQRWYTRPIRRTSIPATFSCFQKSESFLKETHFDEVQHQNRITGEVVQESVEA